MAETLKGILSKLQVLRELVDDLLVAEIQVRASGRVVYQREGRRRSAERPLTPGAVEDLAAAIDAIGTAGADASTKVAEVGQLRWIKVAQPASKGGAAIFALRLRPPRLVRRDLVRAGVLSRPGLALLEERLGRGEGVVIAGPADSGKTRLLGALLDAFGEGRQVVLLQGAEELDTDELEDLVCLRRRALPAAGVEQAALLDLVGRSDVLVVDDVRDGADWVWAAASAEASTPQRLLSLRAGSVEEAVGSLVSWATAQGERVSVRLGAECNLHLLVWCGGRGPAARVEAILALPDGRRRRGDVWTALEALYGEVRTETPPEPPRAVVASRPASADVAPPLPPAPPQPPPQEPAPVVVKPSVVEAPPAPAPTPTPPALRSPEPPVESPAASPPPSSPEPPRPEPPVAAPVAVERKPSASARRVVEPEPVEPVVASRPASAEVAPPLPPAPPQPPPQEPAPVVVKPSVVEAPPAPAPTPTPPALRSPEPVEEPPPSREVRTTGAREPLRSERGVTSGVIERSRERPARPAARDLAEDDLSPAPTPPTPAPVSAARPPVERPREIPARPPVPVDDLQPAAPSVALDVEIAPVESGEGSRPRGRTTPTIQPVERVRPAPNPTIGAAPPEEPAAPEEAVSGEAALRMSRRLARRPVRGGGAPESNPDTVPSGVLSPVPSVEPARVEPPADGGLHRERQARSSGGVLARPAARPRVAEADPGQALAPSALVPLPGGAAAAVDDLDANTQEVRNVDSLMHRVKEYQDRKERGRRPTAEVSARREIERSGRAGARELDTDDVSIEAGMAAEARAAGERFLDELAEEVDHIAAGGATPNGDAGAAGRGPGGRRMLSRVLDRGKSTSATPSRTPTPPPSPAVPAPIPAPAPPPPAEPLERAGGTGHAAAQRRYTNDRSFSSYRVLSRPAPAEPPAEERPAPPVAEAPADENKYVKFTTQDLTREMQEASMALKKDVSNLVNSILAERERAPAASDDRPGNRAAAWAARRRAYGGRPGTGRHALADPNANAAESTRNDPTPLFDSDEDAATNEFRSQSRGAAGDRLSARMLLGDDDTTHQRENPLRRPRYYSEE